MKRLSVLIFVLALLGATSAQGFAAANELAKGAETLTHAPFAGLKDTNDRYAHESLKGAGDSTVGFFDTARKWLVSVGLNFGQPVDNS